MKIQAIGGIFTRYRTLYLGEVERAQRLESELIDMRNRLDVALERAARAEEERSEAYKQFINYQARAQIFAVKGGTVAPPAPPQPLEAEAAPTRRAAQLDGINKFMSELRAHAGFTDEPAA